MTVISIDQRLLNAETSFLEAAGAGGSALIDFQYEWSTLLTDLESEKALEEIDERSRSSRNATASRMLILSEHLLSFCDAASSMTSSLEAELEDIFSRLTLEDDPPAIPPRSYSAHRTPAVSSSHIVTSTLSNTSYLKHAYSWLRTNLHNPYPSRQVRMQICHETDSERKDVDAWFVEMRRRIGWNKMRKEYFNNRRADILDAAAQYFLRRKECGLKQDVQRAFMRMQLLVNDMYNERYLESKLASKFNNAVMDMTPELKAEVEKERRQQQTTMPHRKRRLSLSDSDYNPHPKRPCSRSLAPRPHAVSDPFPVTQPTAFDVSPLAVVTDNIDSSFLLDVELGDFSLFDLPSSPSTSSAQSTPLAQPPAVPELATSLGNTDIDFDFEHLNNWPWNIPMQPTSLEPIVYDLDESTLNNAPPPFDTAIINDNSPFAPHDPASNVDWTSHSFIFSRNGANLLEELQGIGLPAFPTNILGCLPAEQTFSDFPHILAHASKAEKQRALVEAKEFARMLEACIATS